MKKQKILGGQFPMSRSLVWCILLLALTILISCSGKSSYQRKIERRYNCTINTYNHELKGAYETEFGWVGLYETVRDCDRDGGTIDSWTIAGFYNEEPLSITKSKNNVICTSCELYRVDTEVRYQTTWRRGEIIWMSRPHQKKKVEDFEVNIFDPYWLQVSAIVDGELQILTFITSAKEKRVFTEADCPDIRLSEGAALVDCVEDKPDQWWRLERELGDEEIFLSDAFKWIVDHVDEPLDMVVGLRYLAEKWNDAPEDFRDEIGGGLRELLLEDFDCSKLFLGDRQSSSGADEIRAAWKSYLRSIEKILSPEETEQVLETCISPDGLDPIAEPGESPVPSLSSKGWAAIDAQIMARIESGDRFDTDTWLERLEQEPLPSDEIIAQVDQYIIEEMSRWADYDARESHLSQYISARFDHPTTPLSPENIERIFEGSLTEFLNISSVTTKVFNRPELEAYRDVLDEAWIYHSHAPTRRIGLGLAHP